MELKSYAQFPSFKASVHEKCGVNEQNLDELDPSSLDEKGKTKFKRFQFFKSMLRNSFVNYSREADTGTEKKEEHLNEHKEYFQDTFNLLADLANIIFYPLENNVADPLVSHVCKHMQRMEKKGSVEPSSAISNSGDGVNTIVELIFGLVGAIPEVFQRQFGKVIDTQTYIDLAERLKETIQDLADLHFPIFFHRLRPKIKANPKSDFQNLSYKPSQFEIINVADQLHFVPKEKLAQELSEEIKEEYKDQTSFGCPAKYVYDDEGNDLIENVFDRSMQVLKRFYFPRWDSIKEHYQNDYDKVIQAPTFQRGEAGSSFSLSGSKTTVS